MSRFIVASYGSPRAMQSQPGSKLPLIGPRPEVIGPLSVSRVGKGIVTRVADAEGRVFHGVHIDLLAHGAEAMVTLMHFKGGDRVPSHTHPNTQSGYVMSGRIRLRVGPDVDEVLGPGDTYSIPAGAEHSIDVLETGKAIDVFNPPRSDLL